MDGSDLGAATVTQCERETKIVEKYLFVNVCVFV
jgi:hypothetical protein